MNDTNPEMKKLFIKLMMGKTGEERLKFGCTMFDSAKKMVCSSLKEDENKNVSLFLRLYGSDFDNKTKQKIIDKIMGIK
jgi:hypothetical protein